MAEENDKGASAELDSPSDNRQKVPRRKKSPLEAPVSRKRRYREQEKLDILNLIEVQVADRTTTLKAAIKSAGISEQTYYQWKRTVRPGSKAVATATASSDEFGDLVLLENENRRLRSALSEKLRAENAELRRKLGMAYDDVVV